jgi:hypothetical protein
MRRVLLVVAAFAVVGALAGVGWEVLWDAPGGVVYKQRWFLDPSGPDVSFSGTALYVLLALPLGAVLGAGAAFLRGREALTLGTVLVGSVVAAWAMYAVGHAMGPPDPQVLAAAKPDYTRVPSDLVLAARGDSTAPYRSTAFVAFPVGALAGLTLVFLTGVRRGARRARPGPSPQ